jgi:DNA-binding transcriptional regulator GbsR (MarR family)
LDPYEFILEKIDSVPHLEALILLWNSRPVGWTAEELSSRLYVSKERASDVLRDLQRLETAQEIPGPPQKFSYFPRSKEQDELMHQVDTAYRHDLVRISSMIHAKASSPVREFARAFRLRKDKD